MCHTEPSAALQLAHHFDDALAQSESLLPYSATSRPADLKPVTCSHLSKQDQAPWRTDPVPSRNVDLLLWFDVCPSQDAETRRSTPTLPDGKQIRAFYIQTAQGCAEVT